MVTVDDVRRVALTLPRTTEHLIHDRVKFRVKALVYVAFSRDETLMGFGFPKEERAALVASEPEKFQLPGTTDLRFNWVVARTAALDVDEMTELVTEAWTMVVPKGVARDHLGRLGPSGGGSHRASLASVADSRRNPAVDAYLDALPPWQREVAETVRRCAHRADPAVEEVIKRRVQPYFVLEGNICALLGARDHLNVFVYDPIAPDPHGLVNQGQANATARGIQVREGDAIDEAALVELFRAVIANNRAGGWRRVQAARQQP